MEQVKPGVLLAVSILFFFVAGAVAWFKENGVRDVVELRSEIDMVDIQTNRLREKNRAMRLELTSISHSDRRVEAIARKDLGLVKPGETVYEFVDARALATHRAPASAGK